MIVRKCSREDKHEHNKEKRKETKIEPLLSPYLERTYTASTTPSPEKETIHRAFYNQNTNKAMH